MALVTIIITISLSLSFSNAREMNNFNKYSTTFSVDENKQKPSTYNEYRSFEQQNSFPHGLYNTRSMPNDKNAFENQNTEWVPTEFDQPSDAKQHLDAQSQQNDFYANSRTQHYKDENEGESDKLPAYRDTSMWENANNYNQQESLDQNYDSKRKEEVNKYSNTFFEPTADQKYDSTTYGTQRKEEVNKYRDTFFEPTEDQNYNPTGPTYHNNKEQVYEYVPKESYNRYNNDDKEQTTYEDIPQGSRNRYNNDDNEHKKPQGKSFNEPTYKFNGYKFGNPFTGVIDARNVEVNYHNNQWEGEEDEP